MNHSPFSLISRGLEETWKIAEQVLDRLPSRSVIALHGELGSGKTSFVQGLARALGVKEPVVSPTFIMINEYRGSRPLYHIDLYRITTPEETLSIGFQDYLDADGITAVEWAERAGDLIPIDATHISFQMRQDPLERCITIRFPG